MPGHTPYSFSFDSSVWTPPHTAALKNLSSSASRAQGFPCRKGQARACQAQAGSCWILSFSKTCQSPSEGPEGTH